MRKAKSWTRITATLETCDTQDWGSLLTFDLDTQKTNYVALHVMNRGVKSLNCLHLVCLKFNESNLGEDLQQRQILDIKKIYPVCASSYRKRRKPFKIYQYQRNCNWAMEWSLLQPKTGFPNTEMWRSFLEYPTILFDSCFFHMRQDFRQDFPNFVKRSTALEKKYWNQILEPSYGAKWAACTTCTCRRTPRQIYNYHLLQIASQTHTPTYPVNNHKRQWLPSVSTAVPWSSGSMLICWRAHKPQLLNKLCTL